MQRGSTPASARARRGGDAAAGGDDDDAWRSPVTVSARKRARHSLDTGAAGGTEVLQVRRRRRAAAPRCGCAFPAAPQP